MFELIAHNRKSVESVSKEKCLELLAGFCRDPAETLNSLRANHFGLITVLDGSLRYNPNTH